MSELPRGTVTFLFSDIEGSTRLLTELGDRYPAALDEHRAVLRESVAAHGGVEVDTQGDAFFVAFARASDAVAAAAELRPGWRADLFPVRMGLQTGEPSVTAEGYVGLDVHRAARIAAAGHGGQVLLGQATRDLVEVEVRDLGEHRLKDLSAPERLFQLGDGEFPRLRTLYQTNLPVQSSPLVGREREVEDVVSFIRSGTRLLTLTGAGGSGKTRLALHAAAEVAEAFPDGVWFVPLAQVTDSALVEPTIVRAAAPEGGGRRAVASKRALLLLDNMERLLGAGPDVSDILAMGPDLQVIVTSRERLGVRGEQEYEVEPLPLAEAVGLFTQCARRLVPAFEPDEHVAPIAQRVDGLPLALELAAARTKVLSPAQIREKLGRSLDFLTGGLRDAPQRQRTLRATIEWSFALLSDAEQRLLAGLAIFAGSFSADAGEEVAGASLDGLSALVDKSLLRATREGRFFLLETIRDFALECLAAAGDEEQLRERELHYLLRVLPRPWTPGAREEQVGRRRLFDAELGNIRSTLSWLIERGRHADALDVIHRCGLQWEGRGSQLESLRWSELALAGDVHSEVRPEVLARAGLHAAVLGQTARAIGLSEEALSLLRPLGDGSRLALGLRAAAEIHGHAGDLDRGRRLYQECLEHADPDSETWVSALHNYGELELDAGNLEPAVELLERSLAVARSFPGTQHEPMILSGLGDAALAAGDTRRASARYREALTLARAIGLRGSFPYCLAGLAAAEATSGDRARAAVLWGAAQQADSGTGQCR